MYEVVQDVPLAGIAYERKTNVVWHDSNPLPTVAEILEAAIKVFPDVPFDKLTIDAVGSRDVYEYIILSTKA